MPLPSTGVAPSKSPPPVSDRRGGIRHVRARCHCGLLGSGRAAPGMVDPGRHLDCHRGGVGAGRSTYLMKVSWRRPSARACRAPLASLRHGVSWASTSSLPEALDLLSHPSLTDIGRRKSPAGPLSRRLGAEHKQQELADLQCHRHYDDALAAVAATARGEPQPWWPLSWLRNRHARTA